MSGHWYDGLGTGLGSMVDYVTGAPQGSTAMGASAVGTAAQPALDAGSHVAGNTDFGKATGLAPYMKMLGIGQPATAPATGATPASAPASAPAAGPWRPQWGGPSSSTAVTGESETKGFAKITNADGTSGGYQLPSTQQWDAVGTSGGTRASDEEAKTKGIKVGAPEVYAPDLSKIPRTVVGQKSLDQAAEGENVTGAGHFRESASGSHTDWNDPKSGWSGSTKFDPATGKGGTSIYSTGYQAGVEEKEGYRAVAVSDDKRYSATAEAGIVANAGVSGSIGIDTEKGLYATAGIGAKSGAYASADANAKTESIKIGGQDYDAGIGVHGDTFIGAKAGASGTLGIGPDFVGAKGNIGAFVGAEAAADVHANLGPLAGKVGASGMVGAGVGADGDLSYKDGKFHIGGKMFACLGYGGSLSADMTVDVGAIGKSLYNMAPGALDAVGTGLSTASGALTTGAGAVTGAIGDGASSLYNGAADLLSW